jgi:catechol 2,3-dioxygenase
MGTEPVDVEAVVASVEDPEAAFAGMPEGTTVGHVHLRVGDISRARAFYSGLIGFDVVAEMYSALFVSAGGYHHHLGMNTWHSRSAPPAPADSVGLRQFTILVPDADVRDQIVARLGAAGVPVERQESAALVDDPWNNRIHFEPEQT